MLISYSLSSDLSQTDSEIMMSPLIMKCLSLRVYLIAASLSAAHELHAPVQVDYEAVFGIYETIDPTV
jgi:hypothetical protein